MTCTAVCCRDSDSLSTTFPPLGLRAGSDLLRFGSSTTSGYGTASTVSQTPGHGPQLLRRPGSTRAAADPAAHGRLTSASHLKGLTHRERTKTPGAVSISVTFSHVQNAHQYNIFPESSLQSNQIYLFAVLTQRTLKLIVRWCVTFTLSQMRKNAAILVNGQLLTLQHVIQSSVRHFSQKKTKQKTTFFVEWKLKLKHLYTVDIYCSGQI